MSTQNDDEHEHIEDLMKGRPERQAAVRASLAIRKGYCISQKPCGCLYAGPISDAPFFGGCRVILHPDDMRSLQGFARKKESEETSH